MGGVRAGESSPMPPVLSAQLSPVGVSGVNDSEEVPHWLILFEVSAVSREDTSLLCLFVAREHSWEGAPLTPRNW